MSGEDEVFKGQSNSEPRFYGLTLSEILELKKAANIANTLELFKEIAALRSKVSFYEDRISQMAKFRDSTK